MNQPKADSGTPSRVNISGIGYKGLISDETLATLNAMKQKVISGEIVVPNYIDLPADAKEMGKPAIPRPTAN